MKNLKKIRKGKGLTQQEIAKLLNISQATYWGYEIEKYEPSIEILIKLSKILNVSIDKLIGNENEFTIDISNMNEIQQELIKNYVATIKEASWSELMNMHNEMLTQQVYNNEHPEEVKAKQAQREYERKANEAWIKKLQKTQKENSEND